MPINEQGDVVASESLNRSALGAQRDHREDQVNWKHAPDWAAVYAVQNRFGNTSAKWWGAIGDHAADGPQDQDQSTDAPVYFELNAGEPIKMFHRPVAKTATEAEIQRTAHGGKSDGAVAERNKSFFGEDAPVESMSREGSEPSGLDTFFAVHKHLREGENPMVGKVTGYRQLSDAELQLVNDIKAVGPLIESLLKRALNISPVLDNDSAVACARAEWSFKDGAMWLIRAVAKPQGFF